MLELYALNIIIHNFFFTVHLNLLAAKVWEELSKGPFKNSRVRKDKRRIKDGFSLPASLKDVGSQTDTVSVVGHLVNG